MIKLLFKSVYTRLPFQSYMRISKPVYLNYKAILEWIAISFSRESFWPRDQTFVSCIGSWILYLWATSEAHIPLLQDPPDFYVIQKLSQQGFLDLVPLLWPVSVLAVKYLHIAPVHSGIFNNKARKVCYLRERKFSEMSLRFKMAIEQLFL